MSVIRTTNKVFGFRLKSEGLTMELHRRVCDNIKFLKNTNPAGYNDLCKANAETTLNLYVEGVFVSLTFNENENHTATLI